MWYQNLSDIVSEVYKPAGVKFLPSQNSESSNKCQRQTQSPVTAVCDPLTFLLSQLYDRPS